MSQPLRILHLEDDPHDAEIVHGVLDSAGLNCEIRRVQTRDEFTAALEEGGFDLILADFSLPEFDGMSALHIALDKSPELPFIFVSGALGEEVAIDAVKIGATDYVLKQRLSRLVSAVGRALRESAVRAGRTQAEDQLRRSEAFLAEGQRISHTGSWGWVLASGKVVWSEEQYRVLGFEPDSVEPSVERFLSTVHPEDLDRVRHVLERAMQTRQPYEMEYRVLLPVGHMRHLRSVGRPVHGEGSVVEEFIGTTSDISERVEAEAALRSRQDMLDLAQKAAHAVAFECRIDTGEAQYRWSPDLAVMHGLPSDAGEASFEHWKRRVHPDDWPGVEEAIARARKFGDLATEYRVVHADGRIHWLQAKGRMLLDDKEQPIRIVGFMFDVTERHEAEEQLRRLETRLRQAQRLEALGTLAGGIAHDFNNILGAILGYGERVLRAVPHDGRMRRDMENILAAGERGRALVDRVLTFSRSSVGERTPVHVEAVVREALDLVAASLPPGSAIETTLEAPRAAMESDPTQLHQVVMNLSTNAIQAMPEGGILRASLRTIRFDCEQVLTIGTLAPGEYIVLEVADTGTGIPADTLERIFDPFFTTKEFGVGTGLGLSLVHGIVMDAGGAIGVSSTVGAGSRFSVYFPRVGDVPDAVVEAARAREVEVATPHGEGQRVLFVDDEEPLVRLATESLRELGYVPTGFTSSALALEAFRAAPDRFDAVVTDERMPGLSGSALIREMRSIRRAVPILLVSGYVGGTATARDGETGADEVLRKPLSTGELATALARLLPST